VQGCCEELTDLLRAINFEPGSDELWLTGDIVNRGPDSLGALRLAFELRGACRVVLGNHDLHFLAVYYGGHDPRKGDTLDALLGASDVDTLATHVYFLIRTE